MTRFGEWYRRVLYLLNRGRVEAALDEEMNAHRAMMGEPARFGNTLQLRERARDVWGWNWLDGLVRDLRFAARGLRRTPVFTIVVILSLALGFALTATVVAVVNAYLLRTLPYPAVDRLYHVRYAPPGPWEPRGMTDLDWASVQDVVEYPIASAGESFYLGDVGYAMVLRGLRVSKGFTDGLGVSVVAGRRLSAADFTAGADPVALIGHALWQDRFAASPGAIGRLLRTESESRPGIAESFRIVGVLAPDFYYGRDSRTAVDLMVAHSSPIRTYMVRLREGIPPAAAEQRLTDAARRAATSPIPSDWSGVQLESARDRWLGTLRPVLFGVTAASGLVLVIVCANVAVLMLLRSMQRQREVAVRLALGSAWRHVVRMLLAETSLICGGALALGVALTAFLLGTLAPLVETQLGRPAPAASGITLDTTVLAMVGVVCLLAAVALSLAPLTAWGRGLTNALRQDPRVATEGRSMRRVRSALIAFELAGSLVLLVGCGLMIRSVVQMMDVDLGFEPRGLSASRIMLRARHYPDAAAYRRFHERFAGELSTTASAPVVFSTWPPYVPPPAQIIEPDGGRVTAPGGSIGVSAGYFQAFGIPLRQGRDFTPEEASTDAAVAVISESLARRLWPGGSALGQRVRNVEHTQGGSTPGPWRTIIGIAGDVRQEYGDADQGDFYTPRTPDGRFGTFYIRSDRPAAALFDDLRRVAAGIDREAVINPPRRLAGDDQALERMQFMSYLLSAFAAAAAALAMLGIYGVTAYAVQQRRKELAIRVALGASERAVVGIFLREGAWLLGLGTGAGLLGGIAVSWILRNRLFGVQPFDPPTYLVACLLLVGTGLAAARWAARSAVLRQPVTALNGE